VLWLEMSRDYEHGGSGWQFGTCLWSPTEKKGGGRWGYWDLMQRVTKDDLVLHLRGSKNQQFIGHSVADADCYVTTDRPPNPGVWDHALQFYRVPLRDYCPFEDPIPLSDIFERSSKQLIAYHQSHSPVSSANGRFLFYVPQAGSLQCQNGAYLSEVDSELSRIILGNDTDIHQLQQVGTGSGIATLRTRIGQKEFSDAVRDNYSHSCCFPQCNVADASFLIGAHIARWSDSTTHRGNIANGLCLCLMHDKAFETGLFVLDRQFRVVPTAIANSSAWAHANILPFANQQITLGQVQPDIECLQQHWQRVGYSPQDRDTEKKSRSE